MKYSLKFLMFIIVIVAAFLGGWVTKTNFDRWNRPPTVTVKPKAIQTLGLSVDAVTLRTRDNMAAISIGSDDGVRMGMVIHFYRNNQMLGRGMVVKATESMSAVRFIEENNFVFPVQKGDLAQLQY